MRKYIPLSVPNLKGNEVKYVTKVIEDEWVSTAGKCIEDFENKTSSYVKSKFAVACQSGTAGIHLALKICGVSKNDEVIVPTLTFVAAVNPIRYLGAEPIFMDCNENLALDPVKVRKFCEDECEYKNSKLINKRTKRHIKAIIPVHVFGNICDMEKIKDISDEYSLKIIEDATEALGSYFTKGRYKGKYAGTIGDIGIYSFNGNKIITTGGGGMMVSNKEEYANEFRYLSTQAKDDNVYFVHNEIGYNYRMTNLQAALGLAQIEQIENFIKVKQENYFKYKSLGLTLMNFRDDIRPNYWFYSYITNSRDNLMKYLEDNKIQTRPIWKLIHTLKPYESCQTYSIEHAIDYYNRVINIPCSSNLTKSDISYISSMINKFNESRSLQNEYR